jgi:hypothetical protein
VPLFVFVASPDFRAPTGPGFFNPTHGALLWVVKAT